MTTIDWNYVHREQSANNSPIKAVVALQFHVLFVDGMQICSHKEEGGERGDQESVSVSTQLEIRC